MNVQTWDEQVKAAKAAPAPRPTPAQPRAVAPAPDRTIELLERIARNTKVAAFRLGVIELVLFFVLVLAPVLVALLTTRGPSAPLP